LYNSKRHIYPHQAIVSCNVKTARTSADGTSEVSPIAAIMEILTGEITPVADRGQALIAEAFPDPGEITAVDERVTIVQYWVSQSIGAQVLAGDLVVTDETIERQIDKIVALIEADGHSIAELGGLANVRHIAHTTTFTCMLWLSAGGATPLHGVFAFMCAIGDVMTALMEAGVPPGSELINQIARSSDHRAQIFRDCLTPQQWTAIGQELAASFSDPSTADKRLDPDPEKAGILARTRPGLARITMEHFAERQREIWPEFVG
jgi:hypothetical protein